MILPRFKYHAPSTLDEACQILAELKDDACLMAGGTDILVNMKKGLFSTDNLISLTRIERLKSKTFGPNNGSLKIGSCTTAGGLIQFDKLGDIFGALVAGAGKALPSIDQDTIDAVSEELLVTA